jgi:hypothetical protein
MPKRTEVIKKIENAAIGLGLTFELKRRGGNHDIFDLDGVMIPIGRHRDFTNRNAIDMYKECEAKLGKGWWR